MSYLALPGDEHVGLVHVYGFARGGLGLLVELVEVGGEAPREEVFAHEHHDDVVHERLAVLDAVEEAREEQLGVAGLDGGPVDAVVVVDGVVDLPAVGLDAEVRESLAGGMRPLVGVVEDDELGLRGAAAQQQWQRQQQEQGRSGRVGHSAAGARVSRGGRCRRCGGGWRGKTRLWWSVAVLGVSCGRLDFTSARGAHVRRASANAASRCCESQRSTAKNNKLRRTHTARWWRRAGPKHGKEEGKATAVDFGCQGKKREWIVVGREGGREGGDASAGWMVAILKDAG